jgi:hypothetical protein
VVVRINCLTVKQRGALFYDLGEKFRVRLIADSNVDLVFLEFGTLGSDVYSDDPSVRTKHAPPHLEGATEPASDFYEHHILINEFREMPFINRKIVLPFMDSSLLVD